MVGTTVSHYRILAKLGEGGMGVVYKAEDTRLERLVALKFLPEDAATGIARERFLREARAAAQVHHPNICPIHEIDEAEGRLFFAMALVEGSTVRQLLARRPLSVNEALDIAIQVLRGLQAAHSQGVIHRDIKSGNIAVDGEGNAAILDFGLALRSRDCRVTAPGTSAGTPAYMSPEQAEGREVDCRTDVWSAGVVLYEMLTGQLPFRADTQPGVLFAIVHREPPPVATLRPEVPAAVSQILDRALAKDPAQRYQTAAEMMADLRRIRESRSDVTRSMAISPPPPRSRRWVLWAAAAVLILIAAAIGLMFSRRWITPPSKNVAVLPLEVIGGDDNTRALADGLVESLTSKLTQLENFQGRLMVVPASEIRSQHVNSAAAARRLFGVNLVITGSAQRIGDKLQFTLNLVDTRSMRQIASCTIDFGSDPIALRTAALAGAVEILQISLAPAASRELGAGETSTPEAYAQFLMGSGYLARYDVPGNENRAIASLRKAVDLDPKYALAWAALGEAYWRASNEGEKSPQLALNAVERAIQLNPGMAAPYITRAEIGLAQKRVDDAIADALRARRAAPNDGAAYYALGDAYVAAGRMKEAESAYLDAVERRRSDWYAHAALGYFYLRQTRYADSRRAFERARALTPDNDIVNRNLAVVDLFEGRYDEAAKELQHALLFQPSARSYSTLGLAYYYQRRYRDAAESLRKALELDPNIASSWGNLGTVYRHLPGQNADEAFRKAIALTNKALETAPGDNNGRANLAEYYAKTGQCPHAKEQIAQIPASARGAYMGRIALAYEICGDRPNAIATVRSLVRNQAALNEIRNDPDFASLWADPAFQTAIRSRPKPEN